MNLFTMILYVSLLMTIPMAVLMLIYFACSTRYRAKGGEAPYTSGLDYPREDLSVPDVFFWSIARVHGRRIYVFLREKIHNGVLDNWLTWMMSWLVFLAVLVMVFTLM